jgi:integral membrane protein
VAVSPLDLKSVDAALLRYRIMAFVVGVSIIVLICIGVPLEAAADHPGIDKTLGFVHGVLFYPLYILLTIDLGIRTRMHPLRLAVTALLGTVPFVSFYAERQTTQFVRERQAALAHETV